MTSSEEEIAGSNARPLHDTVAETGPGIADDAVLDGELTPGDLGGAAAEARIEALVRSGWTAPPHDAKAAEIDAAQAEAEAEVEAHPS